MSELYVDGIPANTYLKEIVQRYRSGATDSRDMFWSSQERLQSDLVRDIYQVEFSGPRPINHLAFEAAHFPHDIRAEYWHPTLGEWTPLREQIGAITEIDPAYNVADQKAAWEGPEVHERIVDSAPAQISSIKDTRTIGITHPQHFGAGHWVRIRWKVVPVLTKAIRLILVRTLEGFGPVGPTGRAIAYSLGIKNFQAGFRIYSREDIPANGRVTLEDFATSTDLLGSRVSYRLKEYSPSNVLNAVGGLHWKSEPQPVNYAVVNFYADVRDAQGAAQTIDRFYIDPLTVGPTMNLYYTYDDPTGDFAADDTSLHFPIASVHGTALSMEADPLGNTPEQIIFDDEDTAYVDVDNAYLQWDPNKPWWIGIAVRLRTLEGHHPWVSFAGNTLRQNGETVEFITADGFTHTMALPEGVSAGADVSVAVVYTPIDSANSDYNDSTISMSVGGPGLEPQREQLAILTSSLGQDRPEKISVGRYSTEGTPGVPAFGLRGMTLKIEETPDLGVVEGFLTEPDLWILKPEYSNVPDMSTNGLLRLHPRFATPSSPAGAVGGPGDRYDDAVWTPISRDFALRQGFLRIPPTRAKHFKFEFTNLVYETYEALVPIRREVKLFPSEVVAQYQGSGSPIGPHNTNNTYGAHDMWSGEPQPLFDYTVQSPGTQTMMDVSGAEHYSTAVDILRRQAVTAASDTHSRTEAYVAKNLQDQEALKELGWVWTYTPWHVGSSAPKFVMKQRHGYEKVVVEHQSKTAFFVGIRRLDAYRVEYVTDDDTDIYYEHFLDDKYLDGLENVEITDVGIVSVGSFGMVTSKVFPSTRQVRGVQFATVQSDALALLPDDGFVHDDLTAHWKIYGDATLNRRPLEGVVVNRGWYARTYAQVESEFGIYQHMQGRRYGELEGATAEGLVGGGIESEPVTPSASGRIYAAARVAATTALAGPVRLEIVSVDTGKILASDERHLSMGETANLTVGYTVGTTHILSTYADELEGEIYGDLDGTPYVDFQSDPIGGDVYVRLWQTNPSQDQFLIERLSLFDSPVVWQFSVDAGETWCDALDIRNNPEGVLTFPESGSELRWRALVFHPDAEVSALVIRPWYGGLLGALGHKATDFTGPNRSVIDDYPDTDADPMWQQSHDPIPSWWYERDVASIHGGAPNVLIDGEIVVPEYQPPTFGSPGYRDPVVIATNQVLNPAARGTDDEVTVDTNHVTNPSFESGTSGWLTAPGWNLTTEASGLGGVKGAKVGRVQAPEAETSGKFMVYTSAIAASPGEVWSAGGGISRLGGASPSSADFHIRFYAAAGGAIAGAGIYVPVSTLAGSPASLNFAKVEGFVIPEDAVSFRIGFAANSDSEAGNAFSVDGFQAHRSPTLPDYFDGDTSPDETFTYRWSGAANDSASQKVGRKVSGVLHNGSGWTSDYQVIRDGKAWLTNLRLNDRSDTGGTRWVSNHEANGYYAGSVVLMALTPEDVGKQVRVLVHAAGQGGLTSPSQRHTLTADPQKVDLLSLNPMTSGSVSLYVYPDETDGFLATDILVQQVDEAGMSAGPYFDGSTPAEPPYQYRWLGEANASPSEKIVP